MNKADEKQLKKDPRYAAVRDAHHRLRVAYAEAQRIQLEATVAFKQETGLEGTQIPTQEPLPDERLFELLRPRGEAEIRAASELRSPPIAADAIQATWERIEQLCALAESRLRLLLPKLSAPQRAAKPPWLEGVLAELRSSPDAPQPVEDAIRSAESLVRALLSRPGYSTESPEVSWGPLGSVEVRWRDTLTWLVYPSRLPWPGIRARAIVSAEVGRRPESRLFHLAHSLIDHALLVLADDKR